MTSLNREWPRLLVLLSMVFLGACKLGQNGTSLRIDAAGYEVWTGYIDLEHQNKSVLTPCTVMAAGGSPRANYSWSLKIPAPPGLAIGQYTGILYCNSAFVEGDHPFTVVVTDVASSGAQTAQADFTLHVARNSMVPYGVLNPGGYGVQYPLDDAYADKPYGISLFCSGGYPPYHWTEDASYSPTSQLGRAGLTLDPMSGVVWGTVMHSAAGNTEKFRVIVKDSKGTTSTGPVYTIAVH